MSEKDFDEFVRRLNAEDEAQKRVDWNAIKTSWLSDLNDLLDRLTEFLRPQEQRGLVSVVRSHLPIFERHVGTYSAPSLKIEIGERLIEVVPKGMFVIGALGRADIKGPKGEVLLVLVDQEDQTRDRLDGKHSWKVVADKRTLMDLTQDRFFDALISVGDA